MSYFLAVLLPDKFPGDILTSLNVKDVSSTSFGKSIAGNSNQKKVYLITSRGCSTDLVDLGGKENCRSLDFMNLIKDLAYIFPAVYVVLHWSKGQTVMESVSGNTKESISLKEFSGIFPKISQNVRYIIKK